MLATFYILAFGGCIGRPPEPEPALEAAAPLDEKELAAARPWTGVVFGLESRLGAMPLVERTTCALSTTPYAVFVGMLASGNPPDDRLALLAAAEAPDAVRRLGMVEAAQ